MLKAGLVSLVTSSVMVGLRFQEISLFQGFEAKVFCLSGLVFSVTLFIVFYLRSRPSAARPIRLRSPRHAWL